MRILSLENSTKIATVSFLLSLPWGISVSSIGTGIFVGVFLIISVNKIRIRKSIVYLFSLYFLYLVVHNLITINAFFLLKEIEMFLPFFVFPIIFEAQKTFFQKNYKEILIAFAIGVTFAILVMLGVAILSFSEKFYLVKNGYAPVTELIGMHPSYLSLYTSFSFFIVINSVLQFFKNKGDRILKLLYVVWAIFLFAIVFYIRSRFGIIVFLLTIIIYSVISFTKKSFVLVLIGLVIFALLGIKVINVSEFHIGRFKLEQIENSIYQKNEQWEAAIQVIKSNFWFGTSNIKANDYLLEAYRKNDFDIGLKENHNSHNQYLSTLVHSGIIGFTLCFIPLFYLMRWHKSKMIVVSFLILVFLSMITESMLERHKGIVFILFFVCLFLGNNKPKTTLDVNSVT